MLILTPLLLCKLLVTPLITALATYVQKHSHRLAGIITGIPLVSGPIMVFLAIEQGLPFARAATLALMAGQIGLFSYVVAYALLAGKYPWYICWPAAIAVCMVIYAAVSQIDLSPAPTMAASFLTLATAVWVVGRIRVASMPEIKDLPWSMAIRAATVLFPLLIITALAQAIGPKYSGIIAAVPTMWSVIFIFTQSHSGYASLISFVRGGLIGSFSSLTFNAVMVFYPTANGVALFALAAVAAISVSLLIQRYQNNLFTLFGYQNI